MALGSNAATLTPDLSSRTHPKMPGDAFEHRTVQLLAPVASVWLHRNSSGPRIRTDVSDGSFAHERRPSCIGKFLYRGWVSPRSFIVRVEIGAKAMVWFLQRRISVPWRRHASIAIAERIALASETGLWYGMSCLFSTARIH